MTAKTPDQTEPTLLLTPRRSALLAGHDNTLDLLLRAQSPEPPPNLEMMRLPQNLVLVLDCSGSMNGSPHREALRCAAEVISQLDSRDRVGVVTFNTEAVLLVPSQPVIDPQPFLNALATVRSGGNTHLHGGWALGAGQVAEHLQPDHINRILILSDGNANVGLKKVSEITRQCAQLADTGITTSTYGLGHRFNEELMVAMARAGLGKAYYSDTADDLLECFQEEMALLRALYARQLRLPIRVTPGVELTVLNDYLTPEAGIWRLPDLAYNSEVWALLRLRVDGRLIAEAGDQPVALLEVELAYTDVAGQSRQCAPVTLALPAVGAAAFEMIAEDRQVAARAAEVESAELQLRARNAIRRNDWDRAEALLIQARRLAQDYPWLQAVTSEMEKLMAARDKDRLSRESYYTAENMKRRQTAKDELAHDYSAGQESMKPKYQARKARQGKKMSDAQSTLFQQLRISRDTARALGQETVRILAAGFYITRSGNRIDIQQAINAAVRGTVAYPPEQELPSQPPARGTTRIEVHNQTSLRAFNDLTAEGLTPAVLNFASALEPGGGFLSGSRAQEEYLARSSSLWMCLRDNPMYRYHQERYHNPFYSDYVIYSPGVLVLRDDDGELLEKPYPCSILTSPAVHAKGVRKYMPHRTAEIAPVMWNRILKILAVAERHEHDSLVLGAWGCGAFGNDGDQIAGLFRKALEENFRGVFRHIIFAITDWSEDQSFIGPFQRAFANI